MKRRRISTEWRSIYAEEFLPIFTLRGKIYVGYETRSTAQSAIEVGGKNPAELLELLSPFFGKPVGDPAAHNTYKIQRKPAFEFLAKAALQPLTEREKRQAAVLDKLRFFTTRKNLSKFLLTPNGKALKKRDEVLAAKLFRVKVELAGEKAFKLKGELTLPLREEWVRLCDSPEFTNAFGQACSEGDVQAKLARIWKRPTRSNVAHAPARRVFSLPVVERPSGGFRIRRENIFGESVHQVYAINAKKYRGFASVDGKVDWGTGVLFDELKRENLTECGGRFQAAAGVTPMQQWRQVLAEDGLVVWMAPGTEGRRYVRIETSFDRAASWFSDSVDGWNYVSAFQLPDTIKVTKADEFTRTVGEDLAGLLGQPRTYVFFERIDNNRLRFWYTVCSSNQTMNSRYNEAVES